jgi:hypothetical protein
MGPTLGDRDRAILDFERAWWQRQGAKEPAIRSRLGLSGARYYQLLNRLMDSAEAMRYDPLLIKRLRRERVVRRKQRSHGDLGSGR